MKELLHSCRPQVLDAAERALNGLWTIDEGVTGVSSDDPDRQ
jgi:hypothetical protein